MPHPHFDQIGDFAQIAHGDCLDLLRHIPDGSVDMVLTDLPYGNTNAHWDKRIDEAALFKHFWRVDKGNAAVVLFGQFPFACDLMEAARNRYRYKWVWKKRNANTGFLNAHKMPLRNHEDILVFYQALPTYNPQFEYREPYAARRHRPHNATGLYSGSLAECSTASEDGKRFPLDVLEYSRGLQSSHEHPTGKPVDLLGYLIRTYTNPGDTVLDCTMGSGSTGVAAVKEGRRFIGIELDGTFYETARRRIAEADKQPPLFPAMPEAIRAAEVGA